jgi:cation:H+ antiporter
VILGIAALAAGLVVLTAAADRSVLSAARLSMHYGMSPILVGALVIGLGTSIPELVVSIVAGDPTEAMGNVVGSNVSNLTLVLGSAALVAVIAASRSLVLRQGTLMALAMVALALTLIDGEVGRLEGIGLAVGAVVAYVVLIRLSRDQLPDGLEDYRKSVIGLELVMAPLALSATVGGAWLLVWGAERIADEIGLTGAFVGLVILAVGTSLPELATAMAAARRREPDLVVGNVIGSNIFNSLVVGGLVGLVHPGSVDDLARATVLMVVVVGVGGTLLLRSTRLARGHAVALLAGFVALVLVSL